MFPNLTTCLLRADGNVLGKSCPIKIMSAAAATQFGSKWLSCLLMQPSHATILSAAFSLLHAHACPSPVPAVANTWLMRMCRCNGTAK
jgi:hypothetical protein